MKTVEIKPCKNSFCIDYFINSGKLRGCDVCIISPEDVCDNMFDRVTHKCIEFANFREIIYRLLRRT